MLIAVISQKRGPFSNDQGHSQHTGNSAADDRRRRTKQLRYNPGFDFSQLWTALEEDLIDTCHAAPDMIGGLQLSDRVADDGTDRIRRTGHHQSAPGYNHGVAHSKNDRRDAENDHTPQKNRARPAKFMDL